jgi:hypothetical protein
VVSPTSPTSNELGRKTIEVSELKRFGERISELKKQRMTAPKAGDENTVMNVNHREKNILIPRNVFGDEQNLLGLIIGKLALDLGYHITLYKSEKYQYDEPTKEVRDFLTGFAIGTDDLINLKIKSRTDQVEYGRVCAFAFRVRGFFRNNSDLSIAALRKHQGFFGNDPQVDRATKAMKETIILDSFLNSYLSDKKEVPEVRKLLASLLEKQGLVNMKEQVLTACITDNIVKYSEILDRYRRRPLGETKPKKRDSKKAEQGKLPEKPTTSPLLTKEEIDEYHLLTNFIWSALDPYNKDYVSRVRQESFFSVNEKSNLVLNTRWDMLTAFSTVTTKRLQEAKRLLDDPRLSKRKVDSSTLSGLLTARTSHNLIWIKERSQLLQPLVRLNEDQRKLISRDERVWKSIDALEDKKRNMLSEISDKNTVTEEPKGIETTNPFELLEEPESNKKNLNYHKLKKDLIEIIQVIDKTGTTDRRYYLRGDLKIILMELWSRKGITSTQFENMTTAMQKNQKFGPNTEVAKNLPFSSLDKSTNWQNIKSTEAGVKGSPAFVYINMKHDLSKLAEEGAPLEE